MINLKDKKVLITGATGGIGNFLVKKFNELGSNIIATGTNENKLKSLNDTFVNIKTLKFKLDDHEKIENFIEEINTTLGGLDILVNNAGITLDDLSIRLSEESWNSCFFKKSCNRICKKKY